MLLLFISFFSFFYFASYAELSFPQLTKEKTNEIDVVENFLILQNIMLRNIEISELVYFISCFVFSDYAFINSISHRLLSETQMKLYRNKYNNLSVRYQGTDSLRDRHTDTQTARKKDIQTNRQTRDRRTDRQTSKHTDRRTDRQTEGQTNRQTWLVRLPC